MTYNYKNLKATDLLIGDFLFVGLNLNNPVDWSRVTGSEGTMRRALCGTEVQGDFPVIAIKKQDLFNSLVDSLKEHVPGVETPELIVGYWINGVL